MENTGSRAAVAQHCFIAAGGSSWKVREFTGQGAGLNGDGACLVFESDGAMRRIRTFPDNWQELEPDALMRLSWKV